MKFKHYNDFFFIILLWTGNILAVEKRTYTVKTSESLSKISIQLWGNYRNWDQLWRANPSIKNPKLIMPGMVLTIPKIQALSSSRSPSAVKPTNTKQVKKISTSPAPVEDDTTLEDPMSEEWRRLPDQTWELNPLSQTQQLKLLNNMSVQAKKNVFNKPVIRHLISESLLENLGKIELSEVTEDIFYLSKIHLKTTVTNPTVGTTYFLVSEPVQMKLSKNRLNPDAHVDQRLDTRLYFYTIQAIVQIVASAGDIVQAKITQAYANITLETAFIIEYPTVLEMRESVPFENNVTSTLTVEPNLSTNNIASFQHIILNRGTNDGIKQSQSYYGYFLSEHVITITVLQATLESSLAVVQFTSTVLPNPYIVQLFDLKK
jgi:hypothetical protein